MGGSLIYRFGDYSVDDERLELRDRRGALEVQPKVLDLLLFLIRARARVVPQRELLDALWADAEVVGGVLTTAIHEARAALGDSAERQWAIKTFARRGYRFVAPLQIDVGRVSEARAASSRSDASPEGFVGRADTLARLDAALSAAEAGSGGVVVVTGESGIGKTRLLEEFATRSGARGAQVLSAWCYEGVGSPPYWPWMQLLRAAVANESPQEVLLDMGAGAADLAALVPAIHELRPDLPEPPRLQSGQSRFRLFESIATFLANAAKRRTLLLLIDDLHSADHASLRLLAFLAREIRHARILAVVTTREGGGAEDSVLEETLAELARHFPGERLHLDGLSVEETGELVQELSDQAAKESLVRAVAERSEGNPFLVKEIVSLVQTLGPIDREPQVDLWMSSVPPGVRDVILRRLRRRSETCQRLLSVAALLGREFQQALLERLEVAPGAAIAGALAEAVNAGFLRELGEGSYRFTHVLTQESLYAQWSASERQAWHARIGEAMEALAATVPGTPPAALAHHFLKAALEAGADVENEDAVEKAVDYAVRAAEQAVAVYAHDDAARHYRNALEALERLEVPDDAQRCELLIALGTARLDARRSDPSARESLLQAAELARDLAQPEKLARAARELAGIAHRSGPGDAVVIELLESALAELGPGREALEAQVMADLAFQLATADSLEQGAALSQEAVALARKSGDPTILGEILNLRCTFLSGPEHIRDRLREADALLELARETHNPELALFGHRWRLVSMLEFGDIAAADREFVAHEQTASEARISTARWHGLTLRAARAFAEGRLDAAERLALAAFTERRREPTPLSVYTFGTQLIWLRREQARLDEIEDFASAHPVDSRFPMMAVFRATRALLEAERGELESARRELESFTKNGLAEFPHDFSYVYGLSLLSELCRTLDDPGSAEVIYAALAPFADRHVVLFMGRLTLGSVERYLGLLAATMGKLELAEGHFARATKENLRIGARLWVAHTQLDWATMLHAQGGATAGRAAGLLRPCLTAAAEFRLLNLRGKALALADKLR